MHPKTSFNCIQVSGNPNGKHPATTQTQTCHSIVETARNTRPRKKCRKRTDTANAGTFRCKEEEEQQQTLLSPYEIRTLSRRTRAPESHGGTTGLSNLTRDQTNCLHICVPGSGTAKTYCTFEQHTVTCEETRARNADRTQTTGTHDTTASRAPKNVNSVRTLQQRTYRRTEGIVRGVQERTCSMTTNNSHVIGSDAVLSNYIHTETEKRLKQHTAPRIPSRCDTALSAKWCNSVACRTFR